MKNNLFETSDLEEFCHGPRSSAEAADRMNSLLAERDRMRDAGLSAKALAEGMIGEPKVWQALAVMRDALDYIKEDWPGKKYGPSDANSARAALEKADAILGGAQPEAEPRRTVYLIRKLGKPLAWVEGMVLSAEDGITVTHVGDLTNVRLIPFSHLPADLDPCC